MTSRTLKIASLSIIAVGLTTASAFAGGGADCKDKKHSAMKTEAAVTSTASTAVLSDLERSSATSKTMKAAMSFDDALALCQKKGVADLQACVDYKTGKTTVKPQS